MAEPPEAFIGIVLADRYELSSVLGQGQGGMVFKARHRQLDRFVALKMLTPDTLADKTAFMRFEREAHAIGRLNHPNIVTVFDVGRWRNERPFIVMDFIDGQDLQELIGKDGRLPISRAIRICSQICSALSHAHKRGVIHRDLKPRNIMIIDAEDIVDFVKVVDFGIAKPCDSDQAEALTLDGYVVGTPLFMSPEQCSSQPVDARTDIYALGTMLFKMLTGVNPISGKNLTEIMSNQINAEPLSFESACPYAEIPQEIQRVIYRALSKNPADRQPSMSEFRKQMNEAYASCAASINGVATTAGGGGEGGNGNGSSDVAENGGAAAGANGPSSQSAGNREVDSLRERAVGGDALAQYELVLRLEFGQGCKPNTAEAARWLKVSAQKGLKEAQWRLGDHLLRGEGGFDLSPGEGIIWLTKSAEQGYDAAQFALGWCYQHGLGAQPDMQKAVYFYQASAKQGNAQAAEQLKQCVPNLTRATGPVAIIAPLIEDGEMSDDPEVLYLLARKLRDSGKRTSDLEKAASIFRKAASYGHDLAHMALIQMMLLDGANKYGQEEAVQWLENAASQNNHQAKLLLAACLRNGISLNKNPQRAMELLNTLATDEKNSSAQAMLGACFLTGDGAARNIPRGISFLKQAVDAGDGLAAWKMAICQRNGIGVAKDPRMVEVLFNKASDDFFPQGVEDFWKPTALQFSEAVGIFKSMSSSGNKNALLWLGICHENGLGVNRDLNAALQFFQEAQLKGLASGQKAIDRIKLASK